MPGGVCTLGRAAADRRRRRQVPRAAGQADRRAAHRSRRRQEGGSARRLARPRHAGGIRLGEELPDLQELHRHRLLPLRAGRQHGPGAEDRAALPRARQPGQAEAGDRGLPAQLLGGAGQGRRRRRGRGTASGRSTSAAPRARTSARATCCAWSTATTRCCGSAGASSSTTARTPSTRSAPTASSSASASNASGRSSSTTAKASAPSSIAAMQESVDAAHARSLAGARRAGDDQPVPNVAAGAGVSAHGHALRAGPVDQIPPGQGRNFQVGERRVAVFRGRDGCVFATQAGLSRTAAARWPTAWSAAARWSARCTNGDSISRPVRRRTATATSTSTRSPWIRTDA